MLLIFYFAFCPLLASSIMMAVKIRRGGTRLVEKVKVYGADWCGDTLRTLRQLDSLGVSYDYVDVEQDEEASKWVKEQNEGKERKPTLQVAGRVLSTPTAAELEEALRESGVLKG